MANLVTADEPPLETRISLADVVQPPGECDVRHEFISEAERSRVFLRETAHVATVSVERRLERSERAVIVLGHEVGDCALMDAAFVLSRALGHSDLVARLGGDEFVALARDFPENELGELRARIRAYCDERVDELDRPYRLSMSVGGAFSAPGDETSVRRARQ